MIVGPFAPRSGQALPYRSKAERERARWITLIAAIDLLRAKDNCGPDAAWDSLRLAAADDSVKWKWVDPEPKEKKKRRLSMAHPNPAVSRAREMSRYKRGFWEKTRASFENE